MSHRPKVLIIEDQAMQRTNLHEYLERLRFEVHSEGKVAASRELLRDHGENADVVILDMRLQDPEYPGVLGSDLGFELRQRLGKDCPELLILSGYPEPSYFHEALKLGAATYLKKPHKLHEIMHHIRALILRRRLAGELSEKSSRIQHIAEVSPSKKASQLRLCQEVLEPCIQLALDNDYVLLFSDQDGTIVAGSSADDLRETNGQLMENLAGLAFGHSNMDHPFTLGPDDLSGITTPEDAVLAQKLAGVAISALTETRDFRLLLGIFPKNESEEHSRRATIISRYCQSMVTNNLMEVAARWSALQSRRKAMLAATSRFCLQIGERQKYIFHQAQEDKENAYHAWAQLNELGDELYQAGSLLADLHEDLQDPKPRLLEGHTIDLKAVVLSVWESLADATKLEKDLLVLENGPWTVEGESDNLRFIVFSILQWLITRVRLDDEKRHPIKVRFERLNDKQCLAFEDSSRRMPDVLREQLFLPFSDGKAYPPLPGDINPKSGGLFKLFMAKTLMEVRNHGFIEDQTNKLKETTGHRFVLGFPTV